LTESSVMDPSVLRVKEEWPFVFANIGEQHGVKIGMPLRAMRGDEKIATAWWTCVNEFAAR